MSINKEAREAILFKIIEFIGENPVEFSASRFAKQEGLSIQSIYRYLNFLEDSGVINKTKKGRANSFSLVEHTKNFTLPLEGLSEDVVWKNEVAPFFSEIPIIAFNNLYYAFTEMLNNAIDHSAGNQVQLIIMKNSYKVRIWICDDGVGIFNKIAAAMNLEEKSFAILELAKGKFTTDPNSHTGEGIFFSSKVVDNFAIISENLVFLGPTSTQNPYIASVDDVEKGTSVLMEIKYNHTESTSEVFDRFTQAPEDYGFSKTIVPVRLLEYGDEKPLVVSRSQAKRLMVRFERFQNIVLDFAGIEEIGQGFADELFRVFPSQHPNTKLSPVNCNESVRKMIARVRSQI